MAGVYSALERDASGDGEVEGNSVGVDGGAGLGGGVRLQAMGDGEDEDAELAAAAAFDDGLLANFPAEYVGALQGVAQESSRLSHTETRNKRRATKRAFVVGFDGWDRVGLLAVLLAVAGALAINLPAATQRSLAAPSRKPFLSAAGDEELTDFEVMLKLAGAPEQLQANLQAEQLKLAGLWASFDEGWQHTLITDFGLREADVLRLLKAADDLLQEHRELEAAAKEQKASELRPSQGARGEHGESSDPLSVETLPHANLQQRLPPKVQQPQVHLLVERERLALAALTSLRLRLEQMHSLRQSSLQASFIGIRNLASGAQLVADIKAFMHAEEGVAFALRSLLDRSGGALEKPPLSADALSAEDASAAASREALEFSSLAEALSLSSATTARGEGQDGVEREDGSYNTSRVLRVLLLAHRRVRLLRDAARKAGEGAFSFETENAPSEEAVAAVDDFLEKVKEAMRAAQEMAQEIKCQGSPAAEARESVAATFCWTASVLVRLM